MNLQEARKRIPELDGLSDESALSVIQQVYYPDMDRATLAGALGVKSAAAPAPERTWGTAAKDSLVQMAEGVNTTLGAVPGLIAPDSGMAGFFKDGAQYWRDKQSEPLRERIAGSDQRIQEAGKEGVMSQIGTAAAEYWNDPAQAARLVFTNLPSMAATLGTGAAAGLAAKGVAAARGVDAAGKAALAAKYGTTTAAATNAVLNAGGARGEAFEDLKRAHIAQGMTEEQANEAALSGSLLPAAVGGVAGAVSGKLGLEKAVLGQAAAGAGIRKAAGAFGAELAGEQIEELAPKVATNYEVGQVDSERGLTDDLGRTMVETVIGAGPGAVVAGGAAGMRTPAQEAADQIRTTEALPESGALTRAVNAGTEAKAQAIEAGAPLLDEQAEPAPEPVDDPVRDQILALPDGARQDALRAYAVVNRDDVAKGVVQYNRKLLDRLLAENAPPPVLGERLTETDMGGMLGGGGMAGNADPLAGALGMGREAQANSITNVAQAAENRPPMPASDAARMLDEARNQGVELAVAEHPSGGFVLVPPQWVSPDVAAQGETRLAETIARMQQADGAPVERAPRTSTAPVDLSLPTDPVQSYLDTLRTVNTPAARAYVRDFDAGRITPADVQRRMVAEQGVTPDQRIARAAAEAPAAVDPVADRLTRAAAQGMATPAPTDILNPAGQPFKTMMSARLAAKKTPGTQVVPVDGGFVVRPQEPVNVQDAAQGADVTLTNEGDIPEAAPGETQAAVAEQPAGPAAGVTQAPTMAPSPDGVTGDGRRLEADAGNDTAAAGAVPAQGNPAAGESAATQPRGEMLDAADGQLGASGAPARDVAGPAAPAVGAPQEAAPATAKPSQKPRGNLTKKAEAEEKARADYFTPGNIVKSYDGYDRVVGYQPPDADGRWSVTVRPVRLENGKPVDDPNGRERTHATPPDARELKAGPLERAPQVAPVDALPNQAAAIDQKAPEATENVASQPITRAQVDGARQQAATAIAERIDAMSAQEVQKVAARFLPTMGVRVPAGKARIKAAVTSAGPRMNWAAAAAEFGAELPQDAMSALQADVEGRVQEGGGPATPTAGAKIAVNPRVPPENRTSAVTSEAGKEPWQMTALEFGQQENGNPHWNQSYAGKDDGAYLADTAATHRRLVQDAVAAGKLDDPKENIRRGNEAMDRVISGQQDEPNAMTRPDHGPVSFVWGKVGNPAKGFAGGNGIAKIIAKRTAEGSDGDAVARKMVEVIALGTASPVYGPKGGERFNVSHDGHTAVLSLHRFGSEETWLLTGWDDVESDGATAGNADGTYAPESSGMRSQEGADGASVPPAAPAPQPNTPKLTPTEAKALMAWEDMGQKDGVKTHALTFYESQSDKDAKRGRMVVARVSKGDRSAAAWMVDGDDKTFGALSLAKKRGEEVGMAKAVADGFVEAAAQQGDQQAAEFGDIEKALQSKSRDAERQGDVAIVAGGGAIRYVSMDDAVKAVRDAIKSGVRAVPFQIHNATGIRLGDTDKVIKAAMADPKVNQQAAADEVAAAEAASANVKPTSSPSIDSPAVGALNNAIERKERAFAKLKLVREQVKNGTANRLQLLKATSAHRDEVRAVDAARTLVEEVAAKQGVPTKVARSTSSQAESDAKDAGAAFSRTSAGLSPEEAVAMLNAERPVLQAAQRRVSDERMAAAQRMVAGMKQRWARSPEIIVARNMQDAAIPQAVRDYDAKLKRQGATGEARGFIYEGKVYLLADELTGPLQIAETLFHEVLGHYGLRGAFGDALTPILKQMAALRRRDVLAKAREYGLFNKDALGVKPADATDDQVWSAMTDKQRLDAAEEVLAEMAQTTPEIGYVQRAIAAIRTWLRANVPGFKSLALTDAEIIRSYILPARGYVTRSSETPKQSLERAMMAFSRDTNKPMTNKNVVGNQGGRSADDTTPGAFKRVIDAGIKFVSSIESLAEEHGRVYIRWSPSAAADLTGKQTSKDFVSGATHSGLSSIEITGDMHPVDIASRLSEYGFLRMQDRRSTPHVFLAKRVGTDSDGYDSIKPIKLLLDSNADVVKAIDSKLADIMDAMDNIDRESKKLEKTPGHKAVIERLDAAKKKLNKLIPNESTAPDSGGAMFSRTTNAAQAVGDTLKAITATNLKQKAGFKATDYLGIGLQALGRRQIVDIYGDTLPLDQYNKLVQQMEADKNEGGAEADQLVTRWAKLDDEAKLADLMHDATLAQIDPAADFVEGDDKGQYLSLQRKYNLLSADAKKVYADTRDAYKAHHAKVRSAIKERIERSEIKGERKAALLKQMDDDFFKAVKGVYFPLARFGQYAVTVKGADGKVESVSRAETKAEADALRNNLLSAFPRDKGFTVGRVMLSKDFVADRDAVGRGFMTELYQVLDKQDMDAVQRAELEDTLGQLYLSSLPDLSWAKHGIHRKGTPGFSQDARRAFAQNMFHGARYLAKLRYSDLMQDELTAMQRHVDDWREVEDFDQNSAQRVVDEMNKRHESLMNPKSNALSTGLTSLGFVFHLGLSPASAMVNLSQTALVAYPIMGAKWGFGKASAALLKASAEAAKGKNDITGSLNADERAAYDEAVRAGTIDVTMAHDLAGIAQGEDAGVMWKIRPVMRWASFMFHHAERFNRQVTFVAAYRLAREAGADQKAAFEQATKATYDGHFDYGAANRPRIMQGNVAKVLLLFKQYGQNMVYTLARNAQQSIKGESPEARAQARKALGGLLAMHAAAAGVLGLPMVTTLLAAASMVGGDDDEPWDAKVALQNMLADTFGQKAAEVMAHGLSRLTPWDISGRVGLDRLIFPDVQEGLEGQRLWESAATQALGPVGGIFGGLLKGADLMADGHYKLGLEAMLPAVLRQAVKSLRYGMDGVQDKSGKVILDEVSAAGVAGQFLGLSPSEVRLAQEGKSAIYQQDKALEGRRKELLSKAARATREKDAEARTEAMKEIERFNQKNPKLRITPLNVLQSVRNSQRRIDQAEGGVYLPKNRRDAMDAGRFAVVDSE